METRIDFIGDYILEEILPVTQPVLLEGAGPFLPPEAVGFPGLVMSRGQLPVQIHMVLSNGKECLLPIKELALTNLYKVLKGYYEPDQRPFGE